MTARVICRHCGVPIGMWKHGWKHHNGGVGNRSCKTPEPATPEELKAETDAINALFPWRQSPKEQTP